MERRGYDPLSRHGMMRSARMERRERRRQERWAHSQGFAALKDAEAHYDRVETAIFDRLDVEAKELGITRDELINERLDPARIREIGLQCNPNKPGRLLEELRW